MLNRPKWVQWPWEKRSFWFVFAMVGAWLGGVVTAALYWLIKNFPK